MCATAETHRTVHLRSVVSLYVSYTLIKTGKIKRHKYFCDCKFSNTPKKKKVCYNSITPSFLSNHLLTSVTGNKLLNTNVTTDPHMFVSQE